MSHNGMSAFGRRAWAVAAIMVFAGLAPARAEVPAGVRSLLTAALPAAAPATAAPPARPASAPPVRPAALHPAAAPIAPSSIPCRAATEFTRLDHPLTRTAQRLASGKPLTIVAIGSSSTAGAGASSPAASYPGRLTVELNKLFPGRAIRVLNRGVNGEETPDMMARFASGVIAEHPQLVLWQLGTNSVLRDQPLKPHSVELHEGIERLKKAGFDIVLIDPQYAPKVLAKSETPGMVDQIALAAKDENVGLFHRFAVMRGWYVDQHHSFDAFVSPDGLHMNDWGYACWAKLLAASIAKAASSPITAAAERPAP
jgi:acyl-CoA thioesterase I